MSRQKLFDTWAQDYDELLKTTTDFPFTGYQQVLSEVVTAADVRPGMTLLDLGAGTGNLSEKLLKRGCRVYAADFSGAMLEVLHTKLPAVEPVELDLLSDWTVLGKRRFDRIVSSYALHEFALPVKLKLLAQAERYLVRGGRIVTGDIAFSSVAARERARRIRRERWDEDEFYWAADETAAALTPNLEMTFTEVSACAAVMSFQRRQHDLTSV